MAKNSTALEPRNFSLASADHSQGVSLFDRENPDSLINCTEGALRKCLEMVEQSKEARRIIRMNERELRELKPSAQDMRLRISFWDEHSRAVESGTTMKLSRIFAGIVAGETFEENYLPSPAKMGMLLNTPPVYKTAAQEILNTGLERLRDIIELPLLNSKGQVQAPVVNAILKAVDMLDKRIHGMALQKIAVHQHSTHGGGTPIDVPASAQDQVALLEKQISEVRKKMNEKYAVLPSANNVEIVVEKAQDDEET
jgi:hypothetical protein